MALFAFPVTDNETSRTGLLILSDGEVLNQIRGDGYAIQNRNFYNEEPGKTSTLAVPILSKGGEPIGSLGLIYFVSAFKSGEAISQFLKALQNTAALISSSFEKS